MGGVNKTKSISNSGSSYTEFYYHFFRNILIVALPLFVISAIILSSLHISATGSGSGTDSLTISISSACTLSSVVNTEHNTNTNVGTYTSDIGRTTITTLCNDGNGYSVYANGYSNNEEGNNKLINTEYLQYSIDTGLATSGLTSTWAMKLNNIPDDPSPTPPTIESDYNNTYGIVPNAWTKVASRASGTTDMVQGSSFTTTYAVYASSSQYAGTYNGQVKYMLTHPSYQPYIYYMQKVDKWKNTLALEQSVQAIDMRDGKKYWVTKLKDGNVWMTQNLDLDIGGVNTAPLNSNNTDIGTDPNIYANGGIYSDYDVSDGVYTWNPVSTAVTTNTTISNTTVSPAWPTNNYTAPYSAEGGDTYYYTSNSTSNDTRYNSLQACKDANHAETECKHYHIGNYYSWTAAIASNNSSSLTGQYTNAHNSICPKGWRLPIGINNDGSIREFQTMLYKQGIIISNSSNSYTTNGFYDIRKSPIWLVRGGFINRNVIYNGSYGFLHSSTTYSDTSSYGFIHTSSTTSIYNSFDFSRGYGRSVRCLAR